MGEPFSEAELRSAAREELRRLTELPGATGGSRAAYSKAADELDNDEEVAHAIELFTEAGLLERTLEDGSLQPTRKLRSIVL